MSKEEFKEMWQGASLLACNEEMRLWYLPKTKQFVEINAKKQKASLVSEAHATAVINLLADNPEVGTL